ncbi:MAG TPA: oligosaccharide flippase family protein [Anaerolineales bacterium]|nr:oligosaccharide flippase family protein [Anaerolineales bacterium]
MTIFQRTLGRLTNSRDLLNQGLAIDSLRLFLGRLGGQMLGMAFVILLARHLGEAGLGQWSWISGLVLVGNVLTSLGTDTLIMRESAQNHSISTSSLIPALWIQTLLSSAAVALITGLIPNLASQALTALKIYSFALFPLAVYSVFSAALRGRQRMELFLLLSLFTPGAQILGVWWSIRTSGGVVGLAYSLLGIQVLAALLAVRLGFLAEPGLRLELHINLGKVIETARHSWRLAAVSLLAILHQRLGILLLAILVGEAQTGWFSAAFRLVEAVKILHLSVLGALFPRLAANGDKYHGYAQYDLSFKSRTGGALKRSIGHNPTNLTPVFLLLFLVALLAAVSLTLYARPLVQLLYGSSFDPSAQALVILAWSLIPYTYSAYVSLHWVTSGRESGVLRITALTLSLISLFFLGLVPRQGLTGAAWAMLAGESMQAVLYFFSSLWRPTPVADQPPQASTTQVSAFPPDVHQQVPHDQYALSADEMLVDRRRRGTLTTSPAPPGMILCYLRDPRASLLHRRRPVCVSGFSADVYLFQGGKQPVGLAANFGVGAPAAVTLLEELVAWGVRSFISIGFAGGLQPGMQAGDLVIVERAIRDEGVSPHYQPRSTYAYPSSELTENLRDELSRSGCRCTVGSSWTMEAPYRETLREIQAYEKEGVMTVEMETAALFSAGAALDVAVAAAVCVADTLQDWRWRLDFDHGRAENGLRQLFTASLAVLSTLGQPDIG